MFCVEKPFSILNFFQQENANGTWPLKVPAEVAAWRLREMHYSTMSLMHGYSHLDGNGRGKEPQPNNNETIDFWMQTREHPSRPPSAFAAKMCQPLTC